MKKMFFLIAFCAGSIMLYAQDRDNKHQATPDAVRRSYQKEYPNYKDNDAWDMRNNQWHTRHADRDHNNRNVDVYYDNRGRRIRTEIEWNRNDLPQSVKDRIKKKYHYDNYDYDAFRIERPGKGFFFQITLGGNKKVYLDQWGHEVRY